MIDLQSLIYVWEILTNILLQALDAALLHYEADLGKRNAKGSKPNGYV